MLEQPINLPDSFMAEECERNKEACRRVCEAYVRQRQRSPRASEGPRRDRLPTPDDILTLATRDPIAQACVHLWRNGELTWEQALMQMVLLLADAKSVLSDELLRKYQYEPAPFIIRSEEPR